MCESAEHGLEQLNETLLQSVNAELRQILDPAVSAEMTEIRGLEDRLMRLDELRHRAQLIVSEQKELAKAFIQNQARASCVNDPSVLPDLCASHCTQLQVSSGWVYRGRRLGASGGREVNWESWGQRRDEVRSGRINKYTVTSVEIVTAAERPFWGAGSTSLLC